MTSLPAQFDAFYYAGRIAEAREAVRTGRFGAQWADRYRIDVAHLMTTLADAEKVIARLTGKPHVEATGSLFEELLEPVDVPTRHATVAPKAGRDTSVAAGMAGLGRRGNQRSRIMAVYIRSDVGLIAERAAGLASIGWKSSPWKRVSELVEGGWLEDSGRTELTSSRSPSIVWRPTAAARAAWQEGSD